MKHPIRRILKLLFKLVLVIIGIIMLAMVGLYFYAKSVEQPSGSRPPPGYEGRLKYDMKGIPGPSYPKKVPVDIWFGKRDGKYDTTHFRISSDYFAGSPHYHGEAAHIMFVWPSMLSLQEYGRSNEQNGISTDKKWKSLTIILSEVSTANTGDERGTEPFFRCEPMLHDETRGVKYCNENRNIDKSIERFTNYWPLDESQKTPWYKNLPKAHCNVIVRDRGRRFDACSIAFSYNTDVNVTMLFVPEELAIEIITDFNRLTNFLSTLEVQP